MFHFIFQTSILHFRYKMDGKLERILWDFSFNYLNLQPENINDFGIEYFAKRISDSEKNSNISLKTVSGICMSFYEWNKNSIPSKKYDKCERIKSLLTKALQNSLYFNHCNEDTALQIINHFYLIENEKVREMRSDEINLFYIIECGNITISKHECVTEQNGFFHLNHLINDKIIPDNVIIDCKTKLWALDENVFQQFWNLNQHEHCHRYELTLNGAHIFNDLNAEEKKSMADMMITKYYKSEEKILKYNIESIERKGIFFIENGLVSVVFNDGNENSKHILRAGEYFGDLNSFAKNISIESVSALNDVKCAFLPPEQFPNYRFYGDLNLCRKCQMK